jgi:hypothetical protein
VCISVIFPHFSPRKTSGVKCLSYQLNKAPSVPYVDLMTNFSTYAFVKLQDIYTIYTYAIVLGPLGTE